MLRVIEEIIRALGAQYIVECRGPGQDSQTRVLQAGLERDRHDTEPVKSMVIRAPGLKTGDRRHDPVGVSATVFEVTGLQKLARVHDRKVENIAPGVHDERSGAE